MCLCYLARVPHTLLSSLYALYIMCGFISAVEVFAKVAFTPFYEPRVGDFLSKTSWLRFSLMLIGPRSYPGRGALGVAPRAWRPGRGAPGVAPGRVPRVWAPGVGPGHGPRAWGPGRATDRMALLKVLFPVSANVLLRHDFLSPP